MVHYLGAVSALVSCTVLGARLGRFPEPTRKRIQKKLSCVTSKLGRLCGMSVVCVSTNSSVDEGTPTSRTSKQVVGVKMEPNPLQADQQPSGEESCETPQVLLKSFEDLARKLFDEFDEDGSGGLDAEEIANMFPYLWRRLGLSFPAELTGTRLKQVVNDALQKYGVQSKPFMMTQNS